MYQKKYKYVFVCKSLSEILQKFHYVCIKNKKYKYINAHLIKSQYKNQTNTNTTQLTIHIHTTNLPDF